MMEDTREAMSDELQLNIIHLNAHTKNALFTTSVWPIIINEYKF